MSEELLTNAVKVGQGHYAQGRTTRATQYSLEMKVLSS